MTERESRYCPQRFKNHDAGTLVRPSQCGVVPGKDEMEEQKGQAGKDAELFIELVEVVTPIDRARSQCVRLGIPWPAVGLLIEGSSTMRIYYNSCVQFPLVVFTCPFLHIESYSHSFSHSCGARKQARLCAGCLNLGSTHWLLSSVPIPLWPACPSDTSQHHHALSTSWD